MKQKISPGMAVVAIVIAAVVLAGLFYKMNFSGPPPAPPIPMAITGGDAKPVAAGGQAATPGAQMPGMPGGEKGSSGAPTPGAGMMAPTLPGGSGGGGGMMAPTLPGGSGGRP